MGERVDLYTSFHKGIRKLLFDLVVDTGRVDFRDDEATRAICDEVDRTFRLLREHARIEDDIFHPAIEERDPGATEALESEHEFEEELISGIESQIKHLRQAKAAEREPLGLHLYRSIGAFCSSYLDHLASEEEHLMPRFWAAFDDGELQAIRRKAQAALEPARVKEWLAVVIPAFTTSERIVMLADLRDNAPEIFDLVAENLRQTLTAEEWAEVADGLALA